jgi:hypothetical protein
VPSVCPYGSLLPSEPLQPYPCFGDVRLQLGIGAVPHFGHELIALRRLLSLTEPLGDAEAARPSPRKKPTVVTVGIAPPGLEPGLS